MAGATGIGSVGGLKSLGEFRFRAPDRVVSQCMKHASEKPWHVAVHTAHGFVMCVRLRVGSQSGVTLGTLRVVVLFPLHGPTLTTVHLVTAQTTHAPFETGTLRLSRAIVVEAGKTSVGEKARAVVVLRNRNCAK